MVMKYYFFKLLMISAFVAAIVAYFEKVFEVAIFFVLSAILFQMISVEKKQEAEYSYTDTIMSHQEIDNINSRM
jgi:hypothetical protein